MAREFGVTEGAEPWPELSGPPASVGSERKALGSDPEAIRSALRRSGYYAFVVRCDASVDDATLGTVLEAAQASKPPRLQLDVGDLSVPFDKSAQRAMYPIQLAPG